jgi:hypothetical protein
MVISSKPTYGQRRRSPPENVKTNFRTARQPALSRSLLISRVPITNRDKPTITSVIAGGSHTNWSSALIDL